MSDGSAFQARGPAMENALSVTWSRVRAAIVCTTTTNHCYCYYLRMHGPQVSRSPSWSARGIELFSMKYLRRRFVLLGFDPLKAEMGSFRELGSSRESSMQRGASLDVSYDERDISRVCCYLVPCLVLDFNSQLPICDDLAADNAEWKSWTLNDPARHCNNNNPLYYG